MDRDPAVYFQALIIYEGGDKGWWGGAFFLPYFLHNLSPVNCHLIWG